MKKKKILVELRDLVAQPEFKINPIVFVSYVNNSSIAVNNDLITYYGYRILLLCICNFIVALWKYIVDFKVQVV
jgi:hypothetical protein